MLRKTKKVLLIFTAIFLCMVLTSPITTVSALDTSDVDGNAGSGGGINTDSCTSGYCWATSYHFNDDPSNGASAEGLRLTIVDKNGKKVTGTYSHDYFRSGIYNELKNTKQTVYYNKYRKTNGNKSAVIKYSNSSRQLRTVKFEKSRLSNASVLNLPRIWPREGETGSNTRVLDYFINMATNNTSKFMKMLKDDLGYDYYNDKNADEHFLEFEPITAINYNAGERFYVGTVTELMAFMWNHGNRTDTKLGMLYAFAVAGSRALYLSSDQNTSGGFNSRYVSTNDPVIQYNPNNSGGVNYNLDILGSKLFSGNGNTPNPYAHGILWFYSMLPKCDWTNPDHFKDTNGDGKPDSGPGGTNCCVDSSITSSHTKDEIEFAYPICGSCDVNSEPPTATTPSCGTDGSSKTHTFMDTVSWKCMYLDKSKTQMYKVSTINSYCTVYCKESTDLTLPGSYQGYVMTGSSFIWPNSSKYRLSVSGTRECKVKIDYQNWYDDYQSASSSTKTSLVNQIRSCTSDSVLNNRKFAYDLQPTITLSGYKGYRNGKDEDGSTTGSVELVSKKDPTELTNYSVSYSGTVSNFSTSAAGIQAYAESIWDYKTYTATTENQYVLPNDLYSYTNKKTGIISYRAPNSEEIGNYTNRGYGSLAVDDSTIPSGQNEKKGNTVTLTYKKISANNDATHFDKYAKSYTCQYNVKKGDSVVCDYQNPEQFKDLDGDGEPDSGPNGENCCNHFLVQFEGDEEKIQELLEKYPICRSSLNTKCDYNNPSQYTGAPYGTTPGKGPDGINCCEDLRDNYVSYGLTYQEFKQLEQKYQCAGNTGTCSPIPTINDKSCCSDPKYQDYPVCKMEGGINVIYREISLSNPFLSEDGKTRTPGSNWNSKNNYLVSKYITNNRDAEEEEIYTEKPMYIFELDSAAISEIRRYNRGHKFDDFELECADGKDCQSRFIESYLTDTGNTCTTNKGHDISRCNKD